MLIDPLRYAHKAAHRALLIRKTMPELRELIDISRQLYPKAFPGAKFKEQSKIWYFPSGASLEFGYLEKDADAYRYQGQSYTWIGFDEVQQHATDFGFNYLKSRLRTTDPEVPTYMRATANPGSMWVYNMFIKDKEPEKPFMYKGLTHKFIPAKLEDNPHLDSDGQYRAMLESLPELQKRQLLEGDWLVAEDSAFPEFDPQKHIVEPFEVPAHWNRVAGLDYGYRDPAAAVWMAVNPEDGSLVVYREFKQAGLTAEEFGKKIRELENEVVPVDRVVDYSVYAKTGHSGPSHAEGMFRAGVRMRPADKNRTAGKTQIHSRLRINPDTSAPGIYFFSTCTNLIGEIQSAKNQVNQTGSYEDIETKRAADGSHWDLYDCLRYAVMARPVQETYHDKLATIKLENSWKPVDEVFGY
jgi:hypothetical protein